MSDIKLFRISDDNTEELPGNAAALEKSLQGLIEQNMESLLGVQFLASEYTTGPKHGGRIDSLGIDENGCPVIIEYKRAINENVINQGLFYLDWLMDHQAEFKLLVMDQLGKEAAGRIDWSAPRLLCIAGGFTRYDEHAVQQMDRNIELVRYRRFGSDLLLLELVNATSATTTSPVTGGDNARSSSKTITQTVNDLPEGSLRDLFEEVRTFLLALGDDVQEKVLKDYLAFKRFRNFACLVVHPGKVCITVYVKVDPDTVTLEPDFTRDVREIGHYGTGDLEIILKSRKDLNRAKELFVASYEAS